MNLKTWFKNLTPKKAAEIGVLAVTMVIAGMEVFGDWQKDKKIEQMEQDIKALKAKDKDS